MNALSLSSDDPTDHIRYISLYLTDFSEDLDSIVYMDSTSSNIPFQTYFSNGLFEITLDSSLISTISVDSWSELLNNFYYKLNLNNNQIGLCDLKDSFGKSVYEKSFFLYVYLEGQPDSNRLEREIQIVLKNCKLLSLLSLCLLSLIFFLSLALIVFTEIEPIKITNKATYITIDLPMNSYDKERMNFIAAPADSLVEEVKNT